MKLTDIIGLEATHSKLLERAGIKEVEDLLSISYYQIKQMARSIGVTVKTLDTWQEHADLMRIDGVTPKIANALNLIGIDSVKEFAHRNAKNSVEKLKLLKKDNPTVLTKIPTLKEVENWTNQAKKLEEISKKDDKGKKKTTPSKRDSAPVIPIIPNYKPFEQYEKDYGK